MRISVEEYKERLFIYEVIIENQDYRRIKEEQSLRVEFGGFPWYVVGLLKRCCGGVGDKGGFGGGRRRSRRSSGGGGGGGGGGRRQGTTNEGESEVRGDDEALSDDSVVGKSGVESNESQFASVLRIGEENSLEIVESNEFRSLDHLRLEMVKVNDDVVKVSLAERAKRMEKKWVACRSTVSEKAHIIEKKENDIGVMERELARLRREKEEWNEQREIWLKEKQELAYKANQVPALEEHLRELERKTRKLSDLEPRLGEQLEKINTMRAELEECERRRNEAEERAAAESRQCKEAVDRVKIAVAEVTKGNETIVRLEKEIEGLRGRSRIRGSIISRQEQTIKEQEEKLEQLERDLRRTRDNLDICEVEKGTIERRLERAQAKLEENSVLLRDDERVIRYLNRKLNEKMIRRRGGVVTTAGSTTTTTASGESETEQQGLQQALNRGGRRSKSTSPPKTASML